VVAIRLILVGLSALQQLSVLVSVLVVSLKIRSALQETVCVSTVQQPVAELL
jgi:hypothetical protein